MDAPSIKSARHVCRSIAVPDEQHASRPLGAADRNGGVRGANSANSANGGHGARMTGALLLAVGLVGLLGGCAAGGAGSGSSNQSANGIEMYGTIDEGFSFQGH